MSDPSRRAGVFGSVPTAVLILAAAIGAVEVSLFVLNFGAEVSGPVTSTRIGFVQALGFSPWQLSLDSAMGSPLPFGLLGLLTYPFVHFGAIDTVFSVVFVLALGSFVSRLFPPRLVMLAFFAPAFAAGLVYAAWPGTEFPLVGSGPGYTGILGMMAGAQLAMHGIRHPAATPALVSLPIALIALKLVNDTLSGLPGYWLASLCAFCVGLIIAERTIPGGFEKMITGFRRLLRGGDQ